MSETKTETLRARVVSYLANGLGNCRKGLFEDGVVPDTPEAEAEARAVVAEAEAAVRELLAPPTYANVAWTVGDVHTKAEEEGLDLTDAEAEAFLRDNAGQIQDDMVERGWESIATLLNQGDYEDDDADEFAAMPEEDVIARMGWNDDTMLILRKRYIDEGRQKDTSFVGWIRALAREEEAEAAAANDEGDDDGEEDDEEGHAERDLRARGHGRQWFHDATPT